LTDVTSQLRSASSYVTWDLGASQPIRCVLLQGDNNDRYELSGSEDGQSFRRLWSAGPVDGAGMRTRHGRIDERARYLRLDARGGDGRYSVGEVGVFSACPVSWTELGLVR